MRFGGIVGGLRREECDRNTCTGFGSCGPGFLDVWRYLACTLSTFSSKKADWVVKSPCSFVTFRAILETILDCLVLQFLLRYSGAMKNSLLSNRVFFKAACGPISECKRSAKADGCSCLNTIAVVDGDPRYTAAAMSTVRTSPTPNSRPPE